MEFIVFSGGIFLNLGLKGIKTLRPSTLAVFGACLVRV